MNLDMAHEPLRLPAWVTAILAVGALPFLIDLLTGIDWHDAMAAAFTAVIPLLGYTESLRARRDSPATVEARRAKVAASVATPAERALYDQEGQSSYNTVWTVAGILLIVVLVIVIAGAI